MKIAVTSQNFRTITQHAGKARRFIIFEQEPSTGEPVEVGRLELPKQMTIHEFRGDSHPLFRIDQLITGSCGEGFLQRMQGAGVKVVVTSEKDPYSAAAALFAGRSLPAAEPHTHDQYKVTAGVQ